jgi:glycosyltransferase involved in cell wall biosynthesis
MIRILLISHTANLHGAERSLLDAASGMDRSQFEPHVVCPGPGPLLDHLRAKQIAVYLVPMPRPRRSTRAMLALASCYWPAVIQLAKLAKLLHIDLIYNNTIDALYGPTAARLASLPCVWHVREIKPRSRAGQHFFGWLIRTQATRAVFNSLATRDAYGLSSAPGARVIYNGVNLPARADTSFESVDNRRPLNAPVLGYAGQFEEHKAPLVFVDAMRKIVDRCPGASAIMAGDGTLHAAVEERCQVLGLSDRVSLIGWVDDLAAMLNQIDLFVLTSTRESFGRVLIEAMAAGKPVVATRVGGVSEIVVDGETGRLVPPQSPDLIADAALSLIQQPDRMRWMGAVAQQRVAQHFSMHAYVTALEDTFRTVVLERSTNRRSRGNHA